MRLVLEGKRNGVGMSDPHEHIFTHVNTSGSDISKNCKSNSRQFYCKQECKTKQKQKKNHLLIYTPLLDSNTLNFCLRPRGRCSVT